MAQRKTKKTNAHTNGQSSDLGCAEASAPIFARGVCKGGADGVIPEFMPGICQVKTVDAGALIRPKSSERQNRILSMNGKQKHLMCQRTARSRGATRPLLSLFATQTFPFLLLLWRP